MRGFLTPTINNRVQILSSMRLCKCLPNLFLTVLFYWIPSISFAIGQDAVILQSAELTESSGLAVSQHDPTLIWTHNDSGAKPRLYLFDRSHGKLRGLFQFKDVNATDWEDMCVFQVNGRRFLAVGDVGDNHRRRKQVIIHVIEEPLPPPASLFQTEDITETSSSKGTSKLVLPVSPYLTIKVNYPEGAVDCESMIFDSENSRFVLLTKELFRSRVFSVAVEEKHFLKISTNPGPKEILCQAEYVQTLGIPLATAADFCPDSHRLAVCTYGPAYMLEADGLRWNERTMKRIKLPKRKQGEAIAFADSDTLLLTSEFSPTPLWTVPIALNSKEK